MQPIGPPLPRTQTLGNMSCFNVSNTTPSPRKSKASVLSPLQPHPGRTSEVNIADALVESRMSEKEMATMKQVQKEAAANRARQRTAYQHHNLPHHTVSEIARTRRDEGTSNSSLETVVRLGAIKRKQSSGQPLVIDSVLANKSWQQIKAPISSDETSIGSLTSSEPKNVSDIDPRNVSSLLLIPNEADHGLRCMLQSLRHTGLVDMCLSAIDFV